MKGVKLIGIICIVCFFTSNIYGQTNQIETRSIGSDFHTGYILPHYDFILGQTQTGINSIDLSFTKRVNGTNQWQKLFNYPEFGLSLFYTTLGNDEVFGREAALTYFFKCYHNKSDRFRVFSRIGIGLGYVTKRFNHNANYLNLAVGSHFNAHINYRIGADVKLYNNLFFSTGLSFDHYSNANTVAPNLGINYVTLFTGVQLKLRSREKFSPDISPQKVENQYILFFGIGAKRPALLGGSVIAPLSLTFDVDRNVFRKYSFGLGADFFYDRSIEEVIKENGGAFKPIDNYQTGIHISESLVYSKFKFTFQQGLYVGLLNKSTTSSYFRGAIQYAVNKHFLMRIAIKTHLLAADYPEFGFGYRF